MNESTEDSEIDSLIKQLKYSSIPLQRERAAYILANFRDSKVPEVLFNAQLNDPNPRVRDAASQALASLITDEELDEEEQEIDRLLLENKDKVKQLFNITKDFKIIRKGMKKVRPSGKDSLELRQLFKAVKQDRFLQNQPNINSVINAILLLPIEDSDLGRDVAIALTEILRVTSNESLRMSAMGSLNNIITNIDKYTPLFGIAESYI
ncbi:MAG: HEAT repeat domain-containing protein, partial [Candidatus Heimdallarchaeota archaeon]|nr:HEAT repeat domain-containing protein [Candidatus Heimdallarchaeota archaeon]